MSCSRSRQAQAAHHEKRIPFFVWEFMKWNFGRTDLWLAGAEQRFLYGEQRHRSNSSPARNLHSLLNAIRKHAQKESTWPILSRHSGFNNPVIIAKLQANFHVSGVTTSAQLGTFV
jgi:hypothetical protein